jgi:Tfp pilus assembly protein PilW
MSLVELMVSSTLAVIILSAVLSMFLFLGRTSANVINYAEMEAEARRGLEIFAQDTRQASDLIWNSRTSVNLTVNSTEITYSYNASDGSFTRTLAGTTTTLIQGIKSFTYTGYMITGAKVDISDLSTAMKREAASDVTKQIQLYVLASRDTVSVTTATNTVLSARYILRNKRVTA